MSIVNFARKLLLPVAICFSMTAASAADGKSKCQAKGKLLITEYPQLNNVSVDLAEQEIRSPEIIDSVIKDLNLNNSNGYSISKKELLKGITIETKPNKGIFYIYYQHPDSQLATQVVKSLMKNYTQINLLKDKKQAIALQKIVSRQIEQKQQEIKVAGQEVLELSKETEKTTKETQEKIADAQTRLDNIGRELVGLIKRLQELRMVEQYQKNSDIRDFRYISWSCSNDNF